MLFSTALTIICVPFGRTPAGASALTSIVSFLSFTIQLTGCAASSVGVLLSDVPSVNMFSPDEKSASLEPKSSDSLYVSAEPSSDSDSKFTSVPRSSPVSSDVSAAAESSSTSTMSTMSSKELA